MEKIIILTNNHNKYKDFLSQIVEQLYPYQLFSDEEQFKQAFLSYQHKQSLYLLFVEYPYLPSISKYMNDLSLPIPYLLISFYDEEMIDIGNYPNVFEKINTKGVQDNLSFLNNKLKLEIANLNRISLLQYEVKEFYEIGKSLSSEKDTMKLFEMIINSSMNMTSSDAGTIYLVVDKENEKWTTIKDNCYRDKMLKFVIAKNKSIDIQLEASTSPITKESIFGFSIITGKSIRIDDAYHINPLLDYKHNKRFDIKAGYVTKSILYIPMMDHEDNIMGVIQLINKKKDRNEIIDYASPDDLKQIISYDYSDELIMNSLAGQAAVALENNLLYRNMHELLESYKKQNEQLAFLSRKILKAHEEERKRIAREIHDGPAQSTANFSLQLEIVKKLLQKGKLNEVYDEIAHFKKEIHSTVKEIRTIIYDLKPSYLEGGLISALENRFEIFMESTGIQLSFESRGDDKYIEYYMASTIYRIVQEALSNIQKHAKAKNVDIFLSISDNQLSLTIHDDGKGFNVTTLKQKKSAKLEGGFGLEGIQERVELVKGTIDIRSTIGKGTKIEIKIPLY